MFGLGKHRHQNKETENVPFNKESQSHHHVNAAEIVKNPDKVVQRKHADIVVNNKEVHEVTEVQPVIERRREHEIHKPVVEKKQEHIVAPEQHVQAQLPTQHREFAAPKADITGQLNAEMQKHRPVERGVSVDKQTVVNQPQIHEHNSVKVVEEIQPVIEREIEQHKVIHTVQPIKERVIETPQVLPVEVREVKGGQFTATVTDPNIAAAGPDDTTSLGTSSASSSDLEQERRL
ncbi:hypothetical protein MP228_004399 [Amoeboaphelidium protococcarum]|nr:hypothetical protein MP228_004399 [Amoeboaphelidium protococcarum]